jgi:hypothetical protein
VGLDTRLQRHKNHRVNLILVYASALIVAQRRVLCHTQYLVARNPEGNARGLLDELSKFRPAEGK